VSAIGHLHSLKISTGTLGEKKANVKHDFCFALLSPQASSSAKPSSDIPKKELLGTHAGSPRSILARSSSLIARRVLDHDPGNFGNAGLDSRRNPPVSPCVFSSKTHRRGTVSSASTRLPV
jgi:hypothetical protein